MNTSAVADNILALFTGLIVGVGPLNSNHVNIDEVIDKIHSDIFKSTLLATLKNFDDKAPKKQKISQESSEVDKIAEPPVVESKPKAQLKPKTKAQPEPPVVAVKPLPQPEVKVQPQPEVKPPAVKPKAQPKAQVKPKGRPRKAIVEVDYSDVSFCEKLKAIVSAYPDFSSEYTMSDLLGNGSHSCVCKAVSKRTKKEVCVKIELQLGGGQLALLNCEYMNMRGFSKKSKKLAQLHDIYMNIPYPENNKQRVNAIVIDLCGETLKTAVTKRPDTVHHFAKECIRAIKDAHVNEKMVHRDIQPGNFCLKYGSQTELVLIDYGIAEKLSPSDEKEKEPGLIGTEPYAPLNSHLKAKQSYADDIESIAYMIWRFIEGRLPWETMNGAETITAMRNVTTDVRTPQVIKELVTMCRKTKWGAYPNYEAMIALFDRV